MLPEITYTDKPAPAVAKALVDLLLRFNDAGSGRPYDHHMLVVSITDPTTKEITGGLWGSTSYDYLHIDMLFVPEQFRRQRLGTAIMKKAEEEAVRRGCRGSYLDTFSFQARGFYEKLGYAVFGALEDTPPGHSRFFMKKTLPGAASSPGSGSV